ncbi:MAG: glucuronate isomerase [Clostridiales bacterium]|nr:glucuronate isomerase [Clostridiales bacterium]
MKQFMGEDFLLSTETAKSLFNECKDEPIFDWHCHLSPKEIYENKQPENISRLWLSGDHYKWRGMRSCGISEKYITGDASDYEKFLKWAEVMDYCMGNPLYHWTHLELQRYFGITAPLSPRTADAIWNEANEKIKSGGFKPRELIERSNVVCVCTTDDPADTLEYHKLIAEDKSFSCRVLPAFRPEKAMNIEQPSFLPWLSSLEKTAGKTVDSYSALKAVLTERMNFFNEMGCRASDHSLSYVPCVRASEEELEEIFAKGKKGCSLTAAEIDKYRTEIFRFLAKEYSRLGWAMEVHIGAMRNNNTLMFNKIGADTGYDSIGDGDIAYGLSRFLDSLAEENSLPKTILFPINPKDNYVIGTMLGNFQNDDAPSKIQFGSAWWFNDNIDGMMQQMKALGNLGMLGKFVGMVTDSRSFLSYPRHEYFRRILCELLGNMVENGEYPNDMEVLSQTVKNISYYNAKEYIGI